MFSVIAKIKYGKDTLKSCEYSVGGGMLGGYERLVLRRDGDGAVLIHSCKETHADPENVRRYRKDANTLDKAARIALEYNSEIICIRWRMANVKVILIYLQTDRCG